MDAVQERPAALQRLIEQVQEAGARQAPLQIRGGGTKDFLGGPCVGETLEVGALRGISSYEPTELVITVRAGTPLSEVEAALAERGQCLPFEPPRMGDASTIGGVVAAGLAGPSRAAVGGVRDFMLGATMLNGRAEVLSFGGQVMKNVAGYDVSRLLAGSMGVLGVVLEVSLKVLPQAPATRTLRLELTQALALARLNDWGGKPLPLNASAWWDGTLVLRLSGAHAAVEAAARQIGGEVIEEPLAAAFWDGLRDQRDEFFQEALAATAKGAVLWRLSVPQTAPVLKLSGMPLVEWGGAQRWLLSDAPAAEVLAAAHAVGGHARAWRSRQGNTHPQATSELDATLLRIHRQLKQSFDPQALFNRGRLHPDF